ncbi:MAG: dCMP deaminase family protein [Bacilli bacterium]
MKREKYISWDEYFMSIAKLTSLRSKDPSTQVGACIVDLDNRILSVGYNGAPNGYDDDIFPWDREGDPLNTKYLYVCHAEMNAILNFRGSRRELENSTIYVDLFPCNECAKHIIQSGIKKVIYLNDKYKETESVIASKRLMDKCGVEYKQLKLDQTKKIEIDLQ